MEIVQCPYLCGTKTKQKKLQWHIIKCQNYEKNFHLFQNCKYNVHHIIPKDQIVEHERICRFTEKQEEKQRRQQNEEFKKEYEKKRRELLGEMEIEEELNDQNHKIYKLDEQGNMVELEELPQNDVIEQPIKKGKIEQEQNLGFFQRITNYLKKSIFLSSNNQQQTFCNRRFSILI